MSQLINQQGPKSGSRFKRRTITIPEPTPGASKVLRDEFDEFRGRIDALERHRQESKEHRASFERELEDFFNPEENPEVEFDETAEPVSVPSITFEAATIREMELMNLQEELKLRIDLISYLERWHKQAQKSLSEAQKEFEKVEETVRDGLLKLGYVDPEKDKLSPCRIIPDMLHRHPSRFETMQKVRTLREIVSSKPVPENNRAIEELSEAIKAEATRLTGKPIG